MEGRWVGQDLDPVTFQIDTRHIYTAAFSVDKTRLAVPPYIDLVDSEQAQTQVQSNGSHVALSDLRSWSGPDPMPADLPGSVPMGARLVWRLRDDIDGGALWGGWDQGELAKNCLGEFIKLADPRLSEDEDILTFARQWGVLGAYQGEWPRVCTGEKPNSESRWDVSSADNRTPEFREWYWEPVSSWRTYAARMRSALHIADQLSRKKIRDPQDWKLILPTNIAQLYHWDLKARGVAVEGEPILDGDRWLANFSAWLREVDERALFSDVITTWLYVAGLTPRFSLTRDEGDTTRTEISLELGSRVIPQQSLFPFWPPNSLYPVLVAQLVTVLNSSSKIAYCSACAQPFDLSERLRRPRPDTYTFCSRCRESKRAHQFSANMSNRKYRGREVAPKGGIGE